jgi:hypothetical protein
MFLYVYPPAPLLQATHFVVFFRRESPDCLGKKRRTTGNLFTLIWANALIPEDIVSSDRLLHGFNDFINIFARNSDFDFQFWGNFDRVFIDRGQVKIPMTLPKTTNFANCHAANPHTAECFLDLFQLEWADDTFYLSHTILLVELIFCLSLNSQFCPTDIRDFTIGIDPFCEVQQLCL